MKLFIPLLLTLLLAISSYAQTEDVTAEAFFPSEASPTIKKLPLPDYPKAARDAGLTGKVSVAITVDEKGKVVSADDAAGPYPVCRSVTDLRVTALRNSALAAARKAQFQPLDGGAPGGIKGRLIYDFQTHQKGTGGIREERLDTMTKLGSTDDSTGVRVVQPGEPMTTNGGAIIAPGQTVSGGVLNGKATALPKPPYPPAARAVRASGAVSVQVLIIEDGTVYSAKAISGHPLLRPSSETAACGSKFTPVLLEGTPVKVSGVIIYNYVP